jgi:hypothetical protein
VSGGPVLTQPAKCAEIIGQFGDLTVTKSVSRWFWLQVLLSQADYIDADMGGMEQVFLAVRHGKMR